ncbi:DeoR/GlpR family transcriptional regulator of sugar metabolism [Chryseobacterium sp. H1D6B]|uniref:DeoR/GlpR family DNA-binding transcription regulator n=1 Tax=Chryseobacterium sp. H1D6B TaxID=2940588 RepID=UPI0015CDA762|nr:DeoR/GlpR family DNA-binding transcription regulator [Chryseobacterium sp. H1D6B]MDH6253628.1 DeoR/GlpR family transcriptional regulator of sugar metabolism [Chryseobacterium sp. H1D6B]
MLKAERQDLILEYLSKDKKVLLDEISKVLKVSEDTVRRDIKELSDKGMLKAVRGGAVQWHSMPVHFKDRQHIDIPHKKIIAEKVLEYIKQGMVLLVDSGTSALAVVSNFPKDIALTVVTNSFPVVSILEDHKEIEVLFIGGVLNKISFSTTGYETIQAIRNIRADVCLLGICCIDLSSGVTGDGYEDSLIKRVMVETSKRTIALSTSDKLGTSDSFYICAANDLDIIITEADPKSDYLKAYTDAGIEVR